MWVRPPALFMAQRDRSTVVSAAQLRNMPAIVCTREISQFLIVSWVVISLQPANMPSMLSTRPTFQ